MKLVSSNCRGLGSNDKKEAMGKLVRIEKPQILLVQETKLREIESLQELQQIWKKINGVAISARGASEGIFTLLNPDIFQLEGSFKASHWIMVKLVHLTSSISYPIFNVYMPNNYWKK
jgi:exonuclease III